jgi:hypothetical protein
MRKVMAGALAAAALTWAGTGAAADTKADQQQRAREGQGTAMPPAPDPSRRDTPAGDARTQRDATARTEQPKHPLFEGKNNFDLKGKVGEVSENAVTIERKDLPAAKLHVSPNTKLEVDGKKATLHELQQGQDVKASFNLQGDKVEAVEIKADKLKKDDRKEMSEQRRDTQQEMNERARDAQQHNQQKSR